MHDDDRVTVSGQSWEPCQQHVVQGSLAHLDRRIAPDDIELDIGGNLFWCADLHIRQAEFASVVDCELSGPFVDVGSPDRTLWSAQSHCRSDGTGSASEVEKRSCRRQGRSLLQEDLRAGIESVSAEDSGIGGQLEGEVGQRDENDSRTGRRLRLGVEVVGVRSGIGIARGSAHDIGSLSRMSYEIRTFGDPVLVTQAAEVTDIDGKVVRMVDDMFETLYDSDSGIGLAAPQVGIQRQIFVWDMDDDPKVIINPKIVESEGEWVYDEGCLSIPGLFVEMTRPKKVLMRGIDLDGNEVDIEADELEARLFQHELDHLNGVLMFDRMQPEQRARAMAEYKKIKEQGFALGAPVRLEAE